MDDRPEARLRGRDVGEVNFDGLPGPTHNYAGLAEGNLAAARHAREVANPRAAALQGLAKMRALSTRGWPQAVLPPQPRPDVTMLRTLGFAGTDADVIQRVAREAPALLAACTSAAAMWVANAATVTAGADSGDGRVHMTPANLAHHLHRAIEARVTTSILRAIFADPAHFVVHDPLPGVPQLGDEGAANHTRFVSATAQHGVDFMVYGRHAFGGELAPQRFAARQTREATLAIARRHGVAPARLVTAQQLPAAIDAGVFHNDVIAVGHRNVLFCHARSYVEQIAVLDALRGAVADLVTIVVPETAVSLDEAVATYLFNSQLLTRADGRLVLVAPEECVVHPRVRAFLDALVADDGPIAEVMPLDLRQSMRNGGGPACLRLRVPLTPAERRALRGRVLVDAALLDALEEWIGRHYRDRLAPADLADPALLDESNRALDELTGILELPSLYAFQGAGA